MKARRRWELPQSISISGDQSRRPPPAIRHTVRVGRGEPSSGDCGQIDLQSRRVPVSSAPMVVISLAAGTLGAVGAVVMSIEAGVLQQPELWAGALAWTVFSFGASTVLVMIPMAIITGIVTLIRGERRITGTVERRRYR